MKTATDTRRDLAEVARGVLHNTPYGALRRISCEYHDGALILRGELPTYFLKQIAQTVVARLPGVAQVHNQIDVVQALCPAAPV